MTHNVCVCCTCFTLDAQNNMENRENKTDVAESTELFLTVCFIKSQVSKNDYEASLGNFTVAEVLGMFVKFLSLKKKGHLDYDF